MVFPTISVILVSCHLRREEKLSTNKYMTHLYWGALSSEKEGDWEKLFRGLFHPHYWSSSREQPHGEPLTPERALEKVHLHCCGLGDLEQGTAGLKVWILYLTLPGTGLPLGKIISPASAFCLKQRNNGQVSSPSRRS